MAQEGIELEVVFKIKYKADPKQYVLYSDDGEEPDAYEMSRIDAENFVNDPELLFERLVSSSESEITVAPVCRFND